MTTTHNKIDWFSVRERLERFQQQCGESVRVDRDRLNDVFHQRAQRLARRGREETNQAKRTPFIVFRLGSERFGVELTHVKHIFPDVPTTPLPGAHKLLLGVTNLNGSLRSVVDTAVLLNVSAMQSDAGFIVLLHANGRSLGMWVETLEGVCQIDLEMLTPVDCVAFDAMGSFTSGTTDDGTLVLDAASLIEHVAEQRRHSTKQ